MKKLLAIISILLVIFIGMVIYKNSINQNNNLTAIEVQEIEEYISKIYMWKEITEQALPQFDNINNAPDLWIWEVVKKDFEKYELTYYEIQEKAIEIFGDNFKKKFPKEGSEYIYYDESRDRYFTTGIGLDTLDDVFFIKDIKKTKKGYQVQIIEYLEDYEESAIIEEENEVFNIYIKNLEQETVATVRSDEGETRIIEIVKENVDKFTKKTLNLVKDSKGKIFVESVE